MADVIRLGSTKGVEVFANQAQKDAVSKVRNVSKAITSSEVIEKEKKKKTKSKTQKKVEGILTATAAVEVIALTALAAPVLLPAAVSIGLPVAAISGLAPETFSKITGNPDLTEVAIAGAISPAAGIIVGSEKGINVLGAALENAPEVIKENSPAIAAAVGGTAAGVAGTLAAKDLFTTSPAEVVEKVKDIVKNEPIKEAADVVKQVKENVPAAGVPITPTPPITPETVSLEPPAVTTEAKTSTGSPTTRNNQRVDIYINQKQGGIKFINKHRHRR